MIGDPCCPGLLTAEPGATLTHDSVLHGPGSVLMGAVRSQATACATEHHSIPRAPVLGPRDATGWTSVPQSCGLRFLELGLCWVPITSTPPEDWCWPCLPPGIICPHFLLVCHNPLLSRWSPRSPSGNPSHQLLLEPSQNLPHPLYPGPFHELVLCSLVYPRTPQA